MSAVALHAGGAIPLIPCAMAAVGGAVFGGGTAGWWLHRRARLARAVDRVVATEQTARLDRRLEEVNRMTGGLAHEIKNPLSTIGLNVQLLREDLADIAAERQESAGSDVAALERVQRRLDGVHRETSRLRDILDDFLRFAGRIRLDLSGLDIDQAIEELVDFFTPEAASKGIRLQTDLQAGSTPLRADAGLLKQALLNLLMNAVQAMAVEGRAATAPASGVRGDLVVRSRPATSAGVPGVELEVVDTGPGIAPDRLEQVFEPYHTSRRGGTGLGLPTSRRLVELHGGRITLSSEIGKGSCFTLWLPSAGPPDPTTASASA